MAPNVPFTRETTISQGQTIAIVEGVAVKFVGVTGDSRCPADAMCIQGGDAVVKMEVVSDGSKREIELHTGDMRPVTAGGITVALLELSPYPFSSRTISQEEYKARLRVTR